MVFEIKPFHKNSFPRKGILIKGSDAREWLQGIYKLGIDPEKARIYALPDNTANKIFGCLVVPEKGIEPIDIGSNNYMQCINNKLFIPENTITFPEISQAEWSRQFSGHAYVMHPHIGMVELTEEIDWSQLIKLPDVAEAEITRPSEGIYIPDKLHSISIQADENSLAKSIEEQVKTDAAYDLSLNIDKLMKGNHREVDKLLELLKKHPEKALLLGIPLDVMGSYRGGGDGKFKFGKTIGGESREGSKIGLAARIWVLIAAIVFIAVFFTNKKDASSIPVILIAIWLIYKAFKASPDGNRRSSRAARIDMSKFETLQNQYEKLAKDFVAQKEYHKAAAVYLKLLNNPFMAGQVLEEGGYYGEAGAIYLKHCKDRDRAATCFEKGRLYMKAIEIYKELQQPEKVADLYTLLKNSKEANRYYEMVIEDYIKNKQYVRASIIYRKKMKQPLKGQALLLQGWHQNLDAYNCLNNYFVNIENTELLINEIRRFMPMNLKKASKKPFYRLSRLNFINTHRFRCL
ncbi:hypothetical protein [Emticicia fluvialis]|uniref:hypothetical protein n=1 Tax=Emticicia fluvialis TaxID=2974474 RepID=UPI0021657CF1|nr:hypothetical protein [Emticicia fluvialis]